MRDNIYTIIQYTYKVVNKHDFQAFPDSVYLYLFFVRAFHCPDYSLPDRHNVNKDVYILYYSSIISPVIVFVNSCITIFYNSNIM